MIRRKNYRSTGSLELGNHGEISQSLPVRKLTSMRVIKYLILILIGVLIHTAYRALFQTDVTRDSGSRSEINDNKLPSDVIDKAAKIRKEEERDANIKEFADSVFGKVGKQMGNENDDKQINDNPDEAIDKRMDNPPENNKNDGTNENIDQDEIIRNQEIFKDEKREDTEIKKDKKETENEMEKKIQDTIAKILQEDVAEEKINFDNQDKPEKGIMNESVAIKEVNNNENQQNMNENQQNVDKNIQVPVQSDAEKIKADEMAQQEFLGRVKKVEKAESLSVSFAHKHDKPPLVTAGSPKNFLKVKQLIKSIQDFLPNTLIYVFDLGMDETQKNELKAGCHVRVKSSLIGAFPDFVKSLKNFHWRPIVIQMALAEFGHILWLEPGVRVKSHRLLEVLDNDSKIILIGVKAPYTTNAVTNFKMYQFIPTDRKKIKNTLHIDMKALLIHNEEEVNEHFLKFYVACAVDVNCQAPEGTQNDCDFDVAGREYAQCHRYDESALNILLKNWFNYDFNKFYMPSQSYLANYDNTMREQIKLCRNPRDVDGL